MSYVLFAYVGSALLPALKKATTSALQALARRRRWAKAREQINELDDHALRDLGVSRSEFKSYFVESERLGSPPTSAPESRHRRSAPLGRQRRSSRLTPIAAALVFPLRAEAPVWLPSQAVQGSPRGRPALSISTIVASSGSASQAKAAESDPARVASPPKSGGPITTPRKVKRGSRPWRPPRCRAAPPGRPWQGTRHSSRSRRHRRPTAGPGPSRAQWTHRESP